MTGTANATSDSASRTAPAPSRLTRRPSATYPYTSRLPPGSPPDGIASPVTVNACVAARNTIVVFGFADLTGESADDPAEPRAGIGIRIRIRRGSIVAVGAAVHLLQLVTAEV